MILDLDGPSAVGKTTLARRLCAALPGAVCVPELLATTPNPYLHWHTPEDFLEKQLWFFRNTLRRYQAAEPASGSIRLNDMGVLDVIAHTAVYPRAHGLEWEVLPRFCARVLAESGDAPLANGVVYLYAEEPVLRRRRDGDTARVRGAFDSNLLLVPRQRAFYRQLARAFPRQVLCLQAEADPDALARTVMDFVTAAAGAPPLSLCALLDQAQAHFAGPDAGAGAQNVIQ